MAKYSPKVGGIVQLVIPSTPEREGTILSAIITRITENGATLTYFPIGGGAHGITNVPHFSEIKTEDAAYYRSVK